jgi:hypothetical protein
LERKLFSECFFTPDVESGCKNFKMPLRPVMPLVSSSLLPITLAFLMKIIWLASSPVSLNLKLACGYEQDRLSIPFVVQGVRIPNEDFIERSSLKPHSHARH